MMHQEIAKKAFRISQHKPWQTAEDNWREAEKMLEAKEKIDKFEEWKERLGIQTRRMW